MALVYINNVPTNRIAFEQKVIAISNNLGINPDWLMIVFQSESGCKHTAKNGTTWGLIGFTKTTRQALGVTDYVFEGYSNLQQLDLVEKYFNLHRLGGKMKSIYDVKMGVFSPAFVGKPLDFVMYASGSLGYNGNKTIDFNQDGKLTVRELYKHFDKSIPTNYQTTPPTESNNDNSLMTNIAIGSGILAGAIIIYNTFFNNDNS